MSAYGETLRSPNCGCSKVVPQRFGAFITFSCPAGCDFLVFLERQSTILDGEIVRPTASGRDVICRECCEPRYEPDHAATHALVHSLAEDASS